MKKLIITIFAVSFLAVACNAGKQVSTPTSSATPPAAKTPVPTTPVPAPAPQTSGLYPPISNPASRATKIFFGTYVSPGHSPISPERFTGYHTGQDFETTPAEQNTDVAIYAACAGKLLVKEYASGYGGVAVQSCTLNGQAVTIIYGHLRLASVSPAVGDQLKPGQQIAVLGTGYSTETNGERKHLHFGIHKGTAVNILGYVQKQSDLSGWIDPLPYFK